jgi:CDP-diacylglycerol--glycerol-3-phosphate 3-phosphatidyltransferase
LFDGNFRAGVDRATKPVGTALVRWRITADVLTGFGIVIAAACAFAIATGHLWIGFALLILAALPDLLDGPVAKAAGTASIRGAIFDSVADRITDTFVLGGIAWFLIDRDGGHWAILPLALLGASQIISYQRAKAEIYGFDAKGGLMERAERIVALCIGLVFNSVLIPILVIMLVLTVITAGQRFVKVWRQGTEENPVLAARLAARRETRPLVVKNLFAQWTEADESARRRWRERASEQRKSRHASRQDTIDK